MKKSVVKALSLFFALALILSALPVAAFAEEHVHNYVVTKEERRQNVWYNNAQHGTCDKYKHLCACGDVFYDRQFSQLEPHDALPGSMVNLGTHPGPDGGAVTTYRFTCKVCRGTFIREVAS